MDVDTEPAADDPVPTLAVETIELSEGVRLVVGGDVDLATSAQLAGALDDAFRRVQRIELDLSTVGFMDSQGLGVLVHARPEAESSRRLEIVAGSPAVRRLLVVTGLDGVFGLPAELA